MRQIIRREALKGVAKVVASVEGLNAEMLGLASGVVFLYNIGFRDFNRVGGTGQGNNTTRDTVGGSLRNTAELGMGRSVSDGHVHGGVGMNKFRD